MDDHEKSDRPVVPAKRPNKPVVVAGAEVVEGRGLPEGNTAGETRSGRSAGLGVSSDLDRVHQVARQDREVRFTALLHHVSVDRLREAYRAISPDAAAGVDGVTWRDTGQIWRRTFQICMLGFCGARIERARLVGCSYRSPMGGCGRSGSRRWRTRSCHGEHPSRSHDRPTASTPPSLTSQSIDIRRENQWDNDTDRY
jgi:hypothetical protein